METDDKALKVLHAISTPERYLILKSLIGKSKTANEIREEMGYKTNGRAYHHLNALMAASIITKEGDYFMIEPSKVGTILTISLGIQVLASKV
jgi:predicted transcriptional regulator